MQHRLFGNVQHMAVPESENPFEEILFVPGENCIQGKLYALATVSDGRESKEQVVVRCLPRMVSQVATYGLKCTAIVFCIPLSTDSRNVASTVFAPEEIIVLSRMSKHDAEKRIKDEYSWTNRTFPAKPTW